MGEQAKDTGPEFSQQAGGSGTGRLTSRAERPGKTIIDLKPRAGRVRSSEGSGARLPQLAHNHRERPMYVTCQLG